jgi:Fic family protein
LFYWAILRSGFWLFEFISISQIILKAPIQYYMAFLHTETDENDLTYFLIHQTTVIQKAVKELHDYIGRTTREVEASRSFISKVSWLNHRQEALLAHALKHPGQRYTVSEHRGRHGIAYATARSDLLELAEHDLLRHGRAGKRFVFQTPDDLLKRLKKECDE